MTEVELRCADNPHRLFAKLIQEQRPVLVEGNLIEFACRDCAKQRDVTRVLHRFNVAGDLVETVELV